MVQPPWERLREKYHARQFSTERRKYRAQNIINREFIKEEKDFPSVQCFAHGFDFLDRNREADNWLLQIETFDPHEPFTAPARFKEPFDTGWNGPIRDWPRYGRVDELPAECEELRANYYAVVSLCDFLLGQLLDYFDRHDLWKDTALVVTTDHGFLLGEHDFWAKNRMNLYEEIVHIPLFVHDPAEPAAAGARSAALTQIDRSGADLPRPVRRAGAGGNGGTLHPARPRGRCALREAALFRLFRRRGQRHRRPLYLSPLSGRPEVAGDLSVHGDADAYLRPVHAGGIIAGQPQRRLSIHQGRKAAEDSGDGALADVQQLRPRRAARERYAALRSAGRSRPGKAGAEFRTCGPSRGCDGPADAKRTKRRRKRFNGSGLSSPARAFERGGSDDSQRAPRQSWRPPPVRKRSPHHARRRRRTRRACARLFERRRSRFLGVVGSLARYRAIVVEGHAGGVAEHGRVSQPGAA